MHMHELVTLYTECVTMYLYFFTDILGKIKGMGPCFGENLYTNWLITGKNSWL
jgi:hypothetical protein